MTGYRDGENSDLPDSPGWEAVVEARVEARRKAAEQKLTREIARSLDIDVRADLLALRIEGLLNQDYDKYCEARLGNINWNRSS